MARRPGSDRLSLALLGVGRLGAAHARILAGQPVSPTGEDGLAALRVALAATESARRGGALVEVRIP